LRIPERFLLICLATASQQRLIAVADIAAAVVQLQLQLLPHHTGNPSVACHLLPFEVLAVAPQGANRSWWSQLIAFPRRKIRSP